MKGKVVAVCVSARKGAKAPVGSCRALEGRGMEGDVHAQGGVRQVSLLSASSVARMREKIRDLPYGAFGENIVVDGLDVHRLSVGTKLKVGGALLEVSKIGKECHAPCGIRRMLGDCIMPSQGVFAVVREGGVVSVSDGVEVLVS